MAGFKTSLSESRGATRKSFVRLSGPNVDARRAATHSKKVNSDDKDEKPDVPYAPHLREATEAGFAPNDWRGIFVMQGQRLSISSFTIHMDVEGKITSPGPTLSTGVEMAPYWLDIAAREANSAVRLVSKTNEAWKSGDTDAQTKALDAEFKACLQAITAAAFAMDAFYSTVEEAAPTAEATRNAWRRNRTRRSRRVFETLRRNFPITAGSQASLGPFLDQLYSFRDLAVHPTARTREAKKHPRLPVSIDEMFSRFRGRNAWVCVGVVIEMIQALTSVPKIKSDVLRGRMVPLKNLVDPISVRWRKSPAGKRHQYDMSHEG